MAAALALALLWLLLFAIGRANPHGPLQHNIAGFGLPGLLVYPACWYALVFRRRRYEAGDALWLVAASYAACCLLDFAVIGGWLLWSAMLASGVVATSRTSEGFGILAFFALIAVALLLAPYIVTATPVAFLHRAAWLARFARERETT